MQFAIQVGGGQVRHDKTGIEAIVEETQLAESLGFDVGLRARPLRLRVARHAADGDAGLRDVLRHGHAGAAHHDASASAATSPACSSAIPAMHARLFAQVDEASGGRVIAGVGAGWTRAEFAMMGIEFPDVSERLRIMDEAVDGHARPVARRAASRFAGRYFQVTDAVCRPQPGAAAADRRSCSAAAATASCAAPASGPTSSTWCPVIGAAGTTTLEEMPQVRRRRRCRRSWRACAAAEAKAGRAAGSVRFASTCSPTRRPTRRPPPGPSPRDWAASSACRPMRSAATRSPWSARPRRWSRSCAAARRRPRTLAPGDQLLRSEQLRDVSASEVLPHVR